jgi:hypothetical protein
MEANDRANQPTSEGAPDSAPECAGSKRRGPDQRDGTRDHRSSLSGLLRADGTECARPAACPPTCSSSRAGLLDADGKNLATSSRGGIDPGREDDSPAGPEHDDSAWRASAFPARRRNRSTFLRQARHSGTERPGSQSSRRGSSEEACSGSCPASSLPASFIR